MFPFIICKIEKQKLYSIWSTAYMQKKALRELFLVNMRRWEILINYMKTCMFLISYYLMEFTICCIHNGNRKEYHGYSSVSGAVSIAKIFKWIGLATTNQPNKQRTSSAIIFFCWHQIKSHVQMYNGSYCSGSMLNSHWIKISNYWNSIWFMSCFLFILWWLCADGGMGLHFLIFHRKKTEKYTQNDTLSPESLQFWHS